MGVEATNIACLKTGHLGTGHCTPARERHKTLINATQNTFTYARYSFPRVRYDCTGEIKTGITLIRSSKEEPNIATKPHSLLALIGGVHLAPTRKRSNRYTSPQGRCGNHINNHFALHTTDTHNHRHKNTWNCCGKTMFDQ